MRSYQEALHQKTIPQASRGSRIIHRPPAAPIPKNYVLSEAATHVPINGHRIERMKDLIVSSTTHRGGHGEPKRFVMLTPFVETPLTPVFETPVGGGRVGGGGTSREAIQRAKKHALKQGHR